MKISIPSYRVMQNDWSEFDSGLYFLVSSTLRLVDLYDLSLNNHIKVSYIFRTWTPTAEADV